MEEDIVKINKNIKIDKDTNIDEDIKIKLSPYLGCSNNLLEFFVVIGYEEILLNEFFKNNTNGNENKLELSIISSAISDLAYNIFNPDKIIKQVYPDNPDIIQSEIAPKSSNVVFSSCFDSLNGESKVFYSCYGLKFYEKFTINKNEYYIPKAFLILSQYPYFTTFKKICEMVLEYKKTDIEKKIPIEILIHCFVNYIPSPINNSLSLKHYSFNIFIPKLAGYPYIDFDLCKIFSIIPIKDFIKIYILIFLELDLLFFSPDLEKLNIFMYILYILNYPLTDSNYFWHIKSISKSKIKSGNEVLNTSFIGVNTKFTGDLVLSSFRNLNFVIDMEDKKNIINPIDSNKENEEIQKLLKYIHHILNHKKIDKSFFLDEYLLEVKKKLKEANKDYKNLMQENNNNINVRNNSFFYINEEINKINRRIQEIFYDFILNILVILNQDFQIDNTLNAPFKKIIYTNPKYSDEEIIFLNYIRKTIKYNTYFDIFLKSFKAADELKVSLLFSDEYVNLKMVDTNKIIPNNIKYFDIMDKIYSLEPTIKEKNFKSLYDDYKTIKNIEKMPHFIKEKNNQLFYFNQKLIKLFIFHKKNRDCYKILKKEEKIKVDIIDKMYIPFTISYYFHTILSPEYYIKSSLIYIFSMIFPLLSNKDILFFLEYIFKNLQKIKFFQRYYLYIIIKSIQKYNNLNKKIFQFPEFTSKRSKTYCQFINAYLKNYLIIPNEELFKFLKKIYAQKDEEEDENKIIKKKENKDNKFFVYHNKEEDLNKNISNDALTMKDKLLIFNYKGITKNCKLLENVGDIFQDIFSIYDDYFNLNFNLESMNFKRLKEVIMNIIYYLHKYKETEIENLLTSIIILLSQLEKEINDFKEKNSVNKNK